jgi:AcrR family transcriptional regulator
LARDPARDRKNTQRERLLGAMTEVVADGGYDAASIARVIAAAGVARRTFYEQFRDREDCFVAALLDAQERLRVDFERALAAAPPQHATRAAIEAVLAFAATRRAQARVLTSDSLAAGPRALDVRDRGLVQLARSVEQAYARLAPDALVPDLAPAVLLGALYRMIAVRQLRGQADLAKSRTELVAWVASYERPLGEHRWRALEPLAHPTPPRRAAPPLPPLWTPRAEGRLSSRELIESRRRRALFAVAELAVEKGYRAITGADVQRRAGLDAQAFRRLFADKHEAFAAVQEERIQHLTAVTAGAFFAAESWPERIWEAARAFAQVIEQNPAAAHVGFVDVYAAGPRAVQRNDELVLAFTLFLQQGYAYRAQPGTGSAAEPHAAPHAEPHAAPHAEPHAAPHAEPHAAPHAEPHAAPHAGSAAEPHAAPRAEPPSEPPTRLALEAIAATNFEIVYRQIRASRSPKLTGLVAHVTFLCLAPFVGAAAANDFTDGQLRAATATDETTST